jgi:hypothetical protein
MKQASHPAADFKYQTIFFAISYFLDQEVCSKPSIFQDFSIIRREKRQERQKYLRIA